MSFHKTSFRMTCPACEREGLRSSCVQLVARGNAADVMRRRQLEDLGFDPGKPGTTDLEIWRCARCGYLLLFHGRPAETNLREVS